MTLTSILAVVVALGVSIQEPGEKPKSQKKPDNSADSKNSEKTGSPQDSKSAPPETGDPQAILKAAQQAADLLNKKTASSKDTEHDEHDDEHDDELDINAISDKMRRVQQLLAKAKEATTSTKLQSEIAGDLKTLIDQIAKGDRCPECGKQNCTEHGKKRNTSNQQQQSQSQKQQAQQQAEQQSRSNQSKPTQPGQSEAGQASANGANTRLIKAVWGHLPAKVREEMQQSFRESPLPQYRAQIEKYFQTIAEQNNR